MGNKRINLGDSLTSKYATLIGIPLLTVASIFLVLIAVGFEISGSDDVCLGTLEDPCISYGRICNPTPDNYDIYNPEGIKLDFSPGIQDYWMFFKDGRVKKEMLYNLGVNASTQGWRYENFTNATKPRADRIYVHRFAAYSCQDYMLVGLKKNSEDIIKWGFGVGSEYLDPFWYGINSSTTTSVSTNLSLELGSQINISTNITGATTVCVDIDHPDYGDNYTCGSPNANFNFNISYFRETQMNDSTTEKNITFTDTGVDFSYLPNGVTENGTYYWITDTNYDEVFRYYLNGTYVDSFDTAASGNTYPRGIAVNATHIFVADASDDEVYVYLKDGTYQYKFSSPDSYGVATNNTYIWVTDLDNDGGAVFKYYMNGTYISNFSIEDPDDPPNYYYARAMTMDDTYLYVYVMGGEYAVTAYYVDNVVQKYTHAGVFVSQTATPEEQYVGITMDADYIKLMNYPEGELSFFNFNLERVYDREDFYIDAHQYTEIINASINLTGLNYSKVNVYINGTLSNGIGELSNTGITLNTFGGVASSTKADYVDGTTAALDAGDCTDAGCTKFWDGNWSSYATLTGGDDANITVNYTIPSYAIDKGELNFKVQASSSNDLFIYCKNDGSWIDLAAASGYNLYGTDYTQNYTLDIAVECYDEESLVEIKYEFLSVSYPFESELQWYEAGKEVEFSTVGVETFTIDIPASANVTSATFNVTGGLYEDSLEVESITTADTYLVGLQDTVAISQRFIPETANLSQLSVYVYKDFITEVGDLDVWLGTTQNSSDLGSVTIDYNDVSTSPTWELVTMDVDLTPGVTYYITLDAEKQTAGGKNYGYHWYFSGLYDSVYDDGGMTYLISGTPLNFTGDFAFRTYVDDYPENITLEIGDVDGTYEWNYTGEFATTDDVSDFSSVLNTYLTDCTADSDGYCAVPVYIFSATAGSLTFNKINLTYTTGSNPIYLDITLIEDFLNSSSGFVDLPITIESDRASTITVNDIRFDYRGGNDTINILTFNATDGVDKTVNDSLDLIVYYSNWDYEFPDYIDWLEFIPASPTTKNVTPYGQSTSNPILNITNYGYGGMQSNFSAYLNETHDCVNLTISTTTNKSDGFILNDTWTNLITDFDYLNSSSLWMWADYGCSYTTWRLWEPAFSFRNCCENCICSEDLT